MFTLSNVDMISDFVILLESYKEQNAFDIRDFRDAETVGNATDKELLEIYTSRETQERAAINRDRKQLITSTPKKSFDPARRRATSERRPIRSKSLLKTKLPKNSSFQGSSKFVHFESSSRSGDESSPDHQQQNFPRLRLPTKRSAIKDIEPNTNDLQDLIPPDPKALDIDLDNLLLATPENDEPDYDLVSCTSSEGSYYTCDEAIEFGVIDCGRPGLKLDMELLGPPSKDVLKSLPQTEIYKCKRADCGFTTSNALNIKLHLCAKSRQAI